MAVASVGFILDLVGWQALYRLRPEALDSANEVFEGDLPCDEKVGEHAHDNLHR
jgi:hypothetical protein